MGLVSLDLVKKAVRADDFTADDNYLSFLLDAAEKHLLKRTNRTIYELFEEDGDLPTPLKQAVLMLVGHWYNQREAASGVQMAEVPLGFEALVKPYIRLSCTPDE